MSDVTNHERPGVYSVYDASTVVDGTEGGKVVALAALCTKGTAGEVTSILKHQEAVTAFGKDEEITELIRLILLGGASRVVAVPVATDSGYPAAFTAIEGVEDVALVVCDSTTPTVQQALRESVNAAAETRRERIAVLCGGASETVGNLVARAATLNDKRVVLVAPGAVVAGGNSVNGARVAAAVAGAIAAESDPAIPLGGAELKGLSGLSVQYTDGEIDTLVRGGVTPVETVGGTISVVRGVTTRTKSGTVADATWRELTTILITDTVIPALRATLKARFQRTKNTEQNRNAIRTQVILELGRWVEREVITQYGEVSVTAVAEKPTVCLVEFSFTVAHGLNQIWLSAHITV